MGKLDALDAYRRKRDFRSTPEPPADAAQAPPASRRKPRDVKKPASAGALIFVVQKHFASRLHYDFRLEIGGTLKSWAVPKGPSLDPKIKRMAVQVEDHPLAYASFAGDIPPGQYGAGHVDIWDHGTWTPIGDPQQGYRDGQIKFVLHGERLRGRWVLVRMAGKSDQAKSAKQIAWLLIKENDPGPLRAKPLLPAG